MLHDDKVNIIYHTPYEFMLTALLRSSDLESSRLVIDDVDSLGVDRDNLDAPYGFASRVFVDKSRRNNVRPLGITLPAYSLTLPRSNPWVLLGQVISLQKVTESIGWCLGVHETLQQLSMQFAVRCFVGPNKATAYV